MRTRHYETLKDEELRRNIITLRLRDDEHKAVSDSAWMHRTSVSAWLRELALEKLAKEGVKLDMAI